MRKADADFARDWTKVASLQNFIPFLSLDCARVEGEGAQSKEREGSNEEYSFQLFVAVSYTCSV